MVKRIVIIIVIIIIMCFRRTFSVESSDIQINNTRRILRIDVWWWNYLNIIIEMTTKNNETRLERFKCQRTCRRERIIDLGKTTSDRNLNMHCIILYNDIFIKRFPSTSKCLHCIPYDNNNNNNNNNYNLKKNIYKYVYIENIILCSIRVMRVLCVYTHGMI